MARPQFKASAFVIGGCERATKSAANSMSERKVLNKYFPPDFNPSNVPRGTRGGSGCHKVRLMAPFSMRCDVCGEYIYKGKKFNARKETVHTENYLGIPIYRFFIHCTLCHAEISFKTDPKNADYIADRGASRNFEAWRDEKFLNQEMTMRKQLEELLDPMKKLENRTVDSKREIDILDALDEIRTKNARSERVDADDVLEKVEKREMSQKEYAERQAKLVEAQIEAEARIYFKRPEGVSSIEVSSSASSIRRLPDPEDVVVSATTVSAPTTRALSIQPSVAPSKSTNPPLTLEKPQLIIKKAIPTQSAIASLSCYGDD